MKCTPSTFFVLIFSTRLFSFLFPLFEGIAAGEYYVDNIKYNNVEVWSFKACLLLYQRKELDVLIIEWCNGYWMKQFCQLRFVHLLVLFLFIMTQYYVLLYIYIAILYSWMCTCQMNFVWLKRWDTNFKNCTQWKAVLAIWKMSIYRFCFLYYDYLLALGGFDGANSRLWLGF